jgi:UDPglucose 6-dehydrogenase
VRLGIGSDPRIGTHFLYAGCGWGGSCFPKDVRALTHMGQGSGVDMGILRAVQEVNEHQKRLLGRRLVERFGSDLRGHAFAVWGLAFKPETDDLREAPSLVLIEELLARGAAVRAFDPVAMPALAARMGPQTGLALVDDPMQAAEGADALVVVTEWRQFRSPDFASLLRTMRTPLIVDGRNLYDPALVRQLGFEHLAVGRGASPMGLPTFDGAPLRALAA